jgi:hypothetical protein
MRTALWNVSQKRADARSIIILTHQLSMESKAHSRARSPARRGLAITSTDGKVAPSPRMCSLCSCRRFPTLSFQKLEF